VSLLEEAIRQLGGDPIYVSPAARMTEFLGTKIMEAILLAGSVSNYSQGEATVNVIAQQRLTG